MLSSLSQHVDLEKRVQEQRPLKIKFGMDPTAPDLHAGHAVALHWLRARQNEGHHVQLVVGSFTAQIGDPTGKNKTRPPLSFEDVQRNAETYVAQAFKILDPNATTIHYNHDWLQALNPTQFIELLSKVTVSQIMHRDDFKTRWEANAPIAMHELIYPLMQGMDSVHLKSDVELGGSDQWFNLHVGRVLQEKYGQRPQAIATVPLLVGLDGDLKMSKSLDNHLPLSGDPHDTFGRWMSASDVTMWTMLPAMFVASEQEIKGWFDQVFNGVLNPMHVKMETGERFVALYHGQEIATEVRRHFEDRFQKKTIQHAPKETFRWDPNLRVSKLVKEVGFAKSISDACRKMEQRGVRIDGEPITNIHATAPNRNFRLHVGKLHVMDIEWLDAPGVQLDVE
jgi:tyrosyl-tRNA synthetase